VSIGPGPILAILVGLFNTSLFVLIRGTAGGQLPLLLLVAILGAWAGDSLGARLGIDLLRIGDFRLIPASAIAWLGMAIVTVVAVLGPSRRAGAER
jgi:hypothetical protein